jgi:uncharacterized membrane protein
VLQLPPSSHFIYIPVVLVLGIVLGFVMGARATREQIRLDAERAAAREQKKAERAAARAKSSDADKPEEAP